MVHCGGVLLVVAGEKVEEAMDQELKRCQHCGAETVKRIRCNICLRLFCRVCIGMGTTAKDTSTPIGFAKTSGRRNVRSLGSSIGAEYGEGLGQR